MPFRAVYGTIWQFHSFVCCHSSLPKCDCWEGEQYPDLEAIVHDGHKADYNFAAQAKM